MLSAEDNETLTKVGPGSAMGDWMRLFWIPFYPADELVADTQPQRVKLLSVIK